MENLQHNAKRKKMRTRKCLDELRKRSRNNPLILKGPKATNNTAILNGKCDKKGKMNCITSKRLTLPMFGKAVRSETITRPLLCDGKKEHSVKFNTVCADTSPLQKSPKSKGSDDIPTMRCIDTGDFVIQSDCGNSMIQDKSSSDSLIWFSTTQQIKNHQFLKSENEDTVSTVTSVSRLNDDFGYCLYEELLEDIPLYAKRNLESFVKCDVMTKTRTCLQSLYMDNCNQNHGNTQIEVVPSKQHKNVLTSNLYLAPEETIVQNPMNYIKIGWEKCFGRSLESTPTDAIESPLHSPVSPQEDSPHAHAIIPSIVAYTPVYNFYPHRLNE